MVAKKVTKKTKKVAKKVEEDEDEGMSLDDAFGDDDDVEYAESKPAKVKKVEKKPKIIEEDSDDVAEVRGKNIEKIKKGDKMKVNGIDLEVDAHYVLIDHGTTKEMAIELFDPKNDGDYQLRYFADRVNESIEFFELKEIVYSTVPLKSVEW